MSSVKVSKAMIVVERAVSSSLLPVVFECSVSTIHNPEAIIHM